MGPTCAGLFTQFRRWTVVQRREKENIIYSSEVLTADTLSPFLTNRDEHYSAVLTMFDNAIKAIVATERALAPAATSTGQCLDSYPSTSNQDSASLPLRDTASCNGVTEVSRKRCFGDESSELPGTKSRRVEQCSESQILVAVGKVSSTGS